MAYNQQLSVLGQVAPATTGTAGQVLVSAGSSASSYWASAIPVSAYSAQFNGTSQFLYTSAANSAFALGTGDFTVECWFYATYPFGTTGQGRGTLIGNRTVVSSDTSYGLYHYNGKLGFCTATTDIFPSFSVASLSINTWYHVAVTRASGVFKLFINGVLDTTVTSSFNFSDTSAMYIGCDGAYNNNLYKFTGLISNARIVKGVAVYTGAFTPPTSPLGTSQAAGTNISAVTPSQVSLLACNGPGFTDSSPNAFSLVNTSGVVSSQYAPFSSFSAIAKSATQTQTILTSGSGTYYTPSGVAWLRIRMVGGGGGAGGGGTGGANYGGAGSAGTNTVFGSSLLVATSGGGADNSNGVGLAGGAGGTGTINTGATGIVIAGGRGSPGSFTAYATGGTGGATPFGGAGVGYPPGSAGAGTAGSTNSGSGGGGSGAPYASVSFAGHGGGAGGYVEAYISSPSASYAYTIGAGGGGGAGGTYGAGGGGGSGIIIVEENYAVSTVSSNVYTVNYLIVAGGGGGGNYGGGGGAGGMTTGTNIIIPGQIYSITIGAGGAGASSGSGSGTHGSTGTNSSFNYNVAFGGGGGGGNDPSTVAAHTGYNGGSGGGASNQNAVGVAGLGVPGQGYNGGTGTGSAGTTVSGGGGGASAVVGTPNGGAGLSSSITGSAITYAGGGGAGGPSATGSTGGAGGGGNYGVAGTANLGGGGGGFNGSGAFAGGSGLVILSVPTSNYTGTTTGSPTITTNGIYKVLTFTSSGSYTA